MISPRTQTVVSFLCDWMVNKLKFS